jgi:phospholipid-translocating ATPase
MSNFFGSRTDLYRKETFLSVQDLHENPKSPSLASLTASPTTSNNTTTKRRIVVNQSLKPPYVDDKLKPKQKFPKNTIRTSKYTLLTFLPKNLYEQFRGIANFYFLCLVILQIFDIFITVPILVTAAPILFIVIVTGIKDAIEDWRRHHSDNTVNKSFTYLLHEWVNMNYHKPKTSHKRFHPSAFDSWINYFQSLLGKKDKDEMNEKYPLLISAKDYLQHDSPSSEESNVSWARCEWQHVKG